MAELQCSLKLGLLPIITKQMGSLNIVQSFESTSEQASAIGPVMKHTAVWLSKTKEWFSDHPMYGNSDAGCPQTEALTWRVLDVQPPDHLDVQIKLNLAFYPQVQNMHWWVRVRYKHYNRNTNSYPTTEFNFEYWPNERISEYSNIRAKPYSSIS